MEEEKSEVPVYSDLGYIVAGAVIAKAAGAPLDRLLVAHVTAPLGIVDDVFYATALPGEKRAKLLRTAAPTERCEWRGRVVVGEPHDENCAALGGVAAHAGLFGNAQGVTKLGTEMLDVLAGRSTFLPQALLQSALADHGGSNRLGWDTKSPKDSSAGRRMSARTFGHLGFTGTSIWCDPESDIVVTLLTNRIHPSRANQKIKGFRPAFHDGVTAAVQEGRG
jgi:CubicO group peptidase (beta-lactamase class C family)